MIPAASESRLGLKIISPAISRPAESADEADWEQLRALWPAAEEE